MTGGTAVILGRVGDNFGAGMTGGMAFIYDPDGDFERRANPDGIVWQRFSSAHWEDVCKTLVEEHARETDSKWAATIIADWDRVRGRFWQVCPREMLTRLSRSEEHTSELQSLMRISYAVFCLKKKHKK